MEKVSINAIGKEGVRTVWVILPKEMAVWMLEVTMEAERFVVLFLKEK